MFDLNKSRNMQLGAERSNAEIRPFRIQVPQADLDDLRDRLARTRWPERWIATTAAW